jgi:hypothetical protein
MEIVVWHGSSLTGLGQWFGALAEDGEVAAIPENATTPPAGHLLDNTQAFKIGERGVDCGR